MLLMLSMIYSCIVISKRADDMAEKMFINFMERQNAKEEER